MKVTEVAILLGMGGFVLVMGLAAYLIMARNMDVAVVGKAVFGCIGAGGLALSALFAWDTAHFLQESVSAEGTVVRMVRKEHQSTDDDGNAETTVSFSPRVRFTTRAGQAVEFEGLGGGYDDYTEGERVPVRYLPTRPAEARIDEFWQLWIAPVVFAAVGVIFGGVALVTWRLKL